MTFFTDDGSRLHAAVHCDRDRITVTLTGELDRVSAPPLARLLDTAMDGSIIRLQVHMAQLGFVDAAGARLLLNAYRLAADRGVELTLLDPQPHIVWLLHTLDLAAVLPGDSPSADDAMPFRGHPPTFIADETMDELMSALLADSQDERDRHVDERAAQADERDRRADEREEQADDRDRLAQERDRLVDERQQHIDEHQRWADIREDVADTRERALERREEDC
ncbi:STAS domain-containing protein [Couchioplanes caeruleus]|uniref:STAS domain-containing protein n=2 Tax=Couchioplanes caeruleus TaxID=56438 RepID=A0A1K0FDS1_9ACTN|nr:STAS domain-containing protein [Couchioplanes caeruleus]OJF10981.1 hypothetical protein BG844_29000 [Couchioplanes caeruleus subsp. caeruleus]ROP33531.1 anti-anti-sigma factor [Couchioplanes caeruleus]